MTDIAGIKGDLYQASVIARYELIKHIRSKKMYIFLILLGIIFALILSVFLLLDFQNKVTILALACVSTSSIVILVAAILFAATALVSEFEERTALLMFTRPVRKITILAGKFIASALITSLMIVIYFVVFGIISIGLYGEFLGNLLVAIGVAIAIGLCYIGMAFLISSFAKKGSTASILTLVMNLIIISMISMILGFAAPDLDLWFMPDVAASALYVALDIGVVIIGGSVQVFSTVDIVTSVGVLLAWCIGTLAVSYAIFRRREF